MEALRVGWDKGQIWAVHLESAYYLRDFKAPAEKIDRSMKR